MSGLMLYFNIYYYVVVGHERAKTHSDKRYNSRSSREVFHGLLNSGWTRVTVCSYPRLRRNLQGGARNVIPLIVHVTHFYYYKNI